MGCQILGFPIEMAGHPYNSAALPRSLWYRVITIPDLPEEGEISRIKTCSRKMQ